MVAPTSAAPEPEVLGWIEWALVSNDAFRVQAKLDTGAEFSSIDAHDIESFERDGGEWVRFTIRHGAAAGARLERPVERRTTIRRAGTPGDERPVVLLDMRLGRCRRTAEVTLADRAGMTCPLLIGRNYLDGAVLVDSARTFTTEPGKAGPAP